MHKKTKSVSIKDKDSKFLNLLINNLTIKKDRSQYGKFKCLGSSQ